MRIRGTKGQVHAKPALKAVEASASAIRIRARIHACHKARIRGRLQALVSRFVPPRRSASHKSALKRLGSAEPRRTAKNADFTPEGLRGH